MINKLITLIFASLIFMVSCKLAEPVGKLAHNEKVVIESSISDKSNLNKIASPNRSATNGIPANYTPELIKEELSLPTYSVFNIPETIRLMTRRSQNLYTMIDNWYGTPYRLGGTTKKAIDCSAFMQVLYGSIYKYKLPRTAMEQYAYSKQINDKSDLREGDLVFFRIKTNRISHVGIYLADGKFAHASSSKGVVISSLSENYWTRYYAGGGRIEEAVYANIYKK